MRRLGCPPGGRAPEDHRLQRSSGLRHVTRAILASMRGRILSASRESRRCTWLSDLWRPVPSSVTPRLYDEAAVLKAEATMDGARHAGVELSWTTRGRRAHKVVGRRPSDHRRRTGGWRHRTQQRHHCFAVGALPHSTRFVPVINQAIAAMRKRVAVEASQSAVDRASQSLARADVP